MWGSIRCTVNVCTNTITATRTETSIGSSSWAIKICHSLVFPPKNWNESVSSCYINTWRVGGKSSYWGGGWWGMGGLRIYCSYASSVRRSGGYKSADWSNCGAERDPEEPYLSGVGGEPSGADDSARLGVSDSGDYRASTRVPSTHKHKHAPSARHNLCLPDTCVCVCIYVCTGTRTCTLGVRSGMWNLNQTGEIHSVPLEEIRMQSQVLSSSFFSPLFPQTSTPTSSPRSAAQQRLITTSAGKQWPHPGQIHTFLSAHHPRLPKRQ